MLLLLEIAPSPTAEATPDDEVVAVYVLVECVVVVVVVCSVYVVYCVAAVLQ